MSLLPDGTHFDNPFPLCLFPIFCPFVRPIVFFQIQKVGSTYGRKMMTGYITHATGLRLGVNSVRQALKWVSPKQHPERQTSITCHLNPVPYFAEYFGHKLHLDQNEKLVRYGVTEVIAVDGYSSFITGKLVMALKNNIIYRDVFRLAYRSVIISPHLH